METLQAIQHRWGCRKYQDKELSKEHLGLVLDAGRLAPSAGNLQDRAFIIVKSEKNRAEIAKWCGNQEWMRSAPLHIVVLSRNTKYKQFFGERGDLYAIQDTAFTVENMLIAATDLGLGCSLVVGFNEGKISDLLEIKAPAKPHAIITLGYPAEPPKQSAKYPLQQFVWFERFDDRIDNKAYTQGDYSTVRQQLTEKAVKEVKKSTPVLLDKIKSLFKKKEKVQPTEDHFLETTKMEDEEIEIPRTLPRN